jgi:hypothetical protein
MRRTKKFFHFLRGLPKNYDTLRNSHIQVYVWWRGDLQLTEKANEHGARVWALGTPNTSVEQEIKHRPDVWCAAEDAQMEHMK